MALLKELVIDRRKWDRGNPDKYGGALLKEGGQMCCLGFYARACGLRKKDIFRIGMPINVRQEAPIRNKAAWNVLLHQEGIANRLSRTNDNKQTSDQEKEIGIKKDFKKLGVKVTFTH
jgi:hypothetical protein